MITELQITTITVVQKQPSSSADSVLDEKPCTGRVLPQELRHRTPRFFPLSKAEVVSNVQQLSVAFSKTQTTLNVSDKK